MLGLGSRLGLVLGSGGNQTTTLEENCPTVSVRIWVRFSFGVRSNFPRGKLACSFIKKETLAQVFSCKFYKISKITFYYRIPVVAPSEYGELLTG